MKTKYYSPITPLAQKLIDTLFSEGQLICKELDTYNHNQEAQKMADGIGRGFSNYLKQKSQSQNKNNQKKHNLRDSTGKFRKTEKWAEFIYPVGDSVSIYNIELKRVKIDEDNFEYLTGWYKTGDYRKFLKSKIQGKIHYYKQ